MIYGYCRISRPKQSIDRQIRNILSAFPNAVIIQEIYTRTSLNRKEWQKLFSKVKPGDTIVFDSVSRMSGSAEEGSEAYEELYDRGVELVFLKERHIDTATYKKALESNIALTGTSVDFILEGVNNYLIALAKEQIRLAFEQSEKEVQDLRQRTREGVETARLAGKKIGRQPGSKITVKKAGPAKEQIKKLNRDFGGPLSNEETWKLIRISKMTFYKYKRELLEEAENKDVQTALLLLITDVKAIYFFNIFFISV